MPSPDILNAANAELLEEIYRQYRADPASVGGDWAEFFAGLDDPRSGARHGSTGGNGQAAAAPAAAPQIPTPASAPPTVAGVYGLVQAYRDLGHLEADINPLEPPAEQHPLLHLREYGFSDADLGRSVGRGNFLGETDGTLADLIAKLRTTYCGTMGVEYTHITDKEQREWLQQRMEPALNRPAPSREDRLKLLGLLADAEEFERFLVLKYGASKKRFGVEGAEALIAMLDTLVTECAAQGVAEVVMGMAHRGRLNVLANVLHKPLATMFAEIEDSEKPDENNEGDGDVKYHLGHSHDRIFPDGRKIHLSMGFNPSHLELVNPVIEGMVGGKQSRKGDREGRYVVPVLMHGDAAFTGQGVVMETLTLTRLDGYETGGTVHIVIDNQVGFTAEAHECRFTRYPTDIMKMAQAPIFHVNADDPEAAVHAMRLAVAFRQRFRTDVMIHLLGYRRNGHNEADEPRFTQPLMYAKIDKRPPVRELYARRLIETGSATPDEAAAASAAARRRLDEAFASERSGKAKKSGQVLGGLWKGLQRADRDAALWPNPATGVDADTLVSIVESITRFPEGFNVHPRIKKNYYDKWLGNVREGKGIEWATGEVLALGSLLLEGTPVRLVGQDTERGTFSHRQAVLKDTANGAKYTPLANLKPGQAKFTIVNTMLSELAVMGFEYGFCLSDPWTLVMWEAQFGDFANGAQALIDQFLVSGESKWNRMNGLVLLLPHGYEGQGPEHSNARPERFLQLCAENNIQVCWPTTPAQYFHMLRRQIRRNFRKPLVVMTPKSLLRGGSGAVSTLDEFTKGSFRPVVDDPGVARKDKVRRIIFCSGKIYYTLNAARSAKGLEHVAIVRLEQPYPFPAEELKAVAASYPHASDAMWAQEEPRNMGGWRFVRQRIQDLLDALPNRLTLRYEGRKNAASPATGSFKQHEHEEQAIIAAALSVGPGTAAAAMAATAPSEDTAAAAESDAPPAKNLKPDTLAAGGRP
jgi:2-oxoglutarate dehydrogenase E1 component